MIKFPKWCTLTKFPVHYDTESVTGIEQTARVYGKINELIDNYNTYIENINKIFENHITLADKDRETFAVAMRQEFQEFINVVDLKVLELEDIMKANLIDEIRKLWSEIKDTGEIQEVFIETLNRITSVVDEQTESIKAFKSDINEEVSNFEERVNNSNFEFKNEVNITLREYEKSNNDFKNEVNENINDRLSEKVIFEGERYCHIEGDPNLVIDNINDLTKYSTIAVFFKYWCYDPFEQEWYENDGKILLNQFKYTRIENGVNISCMEYNGMFYREVIDETLKNTSIDIEYISLHSIKDNSGYDNELMVDFDFINHAMTFSQTDTPGEESIAITKIVGIM